MLGMHVFHRELRVRNAVRHERFLPRLGGRVCIWLEQELYAIGIARRGQGQPSICACRDIVLRLETQYVAVKGQRLVLIIDQDARYDDLQRFLLRMRARPGGQATRARAGATVLAPESGASSATAIRCGPVLPPPTLSGALRAPDASAPRRASWSGGRAVRRASVHRVRPVRPEDADASGRTAL